MQTVDFSKFEEVKIQNLQIKIIFHMDLFLKNSDIFKGFSFNKVLIFQEFGKN
jgi:hypothetical protein